MGRKINYTLPEYEFDHATIASNLAKFYKAITVKSIKYDNLESTPEGLSSEVIESTLYDKGEAIFFKDDKFGYMCLPFNVVNKYNVYGKPTEFIAVGQNGYTKHLTIDNSVIIKNDANSTPTTVMVNMYCSILADIEITKDMRRIAHRTPFILECTEDTVLSAKNTYNNIRLFKPVEYKNKARGEAGVGVNVLDTGVEYINDKLEDEYNNYIAKILTYLGMDNYVQDKKERVGSFEVESNDEYINGAFKARLDCRKDAVERINKMFGLNLAVTYVVGEQIEEDKPATKEEENTPNE